jgi:hypothetical protein
VPRSLVERGGFAFAGSAAESDAERANPWLLLDKPLADGEIPVVLDKNTAMYSLHLHQGVGSTYDIDDGRGGTLRLRVVGLLDGSILQGDLLISEAQFQKHFPQLAGYRFFLVSVPTNPGATTSERDAAIAAAQKVLENRLGDWGFDAERAPSRLASLLAVQNTYLSTFQSLGALGLLLGTFGLATVQLRNVLERRSELALLRAGGFRRSRLGRLVLAENVLLLVGGLATGVAAALVAVLPHFLVGGVGVPWRSLAAMLGIVLAVGFVAGLLTVRAVLRAPLLAALRGE